MKKKLIKRNKKSTQSLIAYKKYAPILEYRVRPGKNWVRVQYSDRMTKSPLCGLFNTLYSEPCYSYNTRTKNKYKVLTAYMVTPVIHKGILLENSNIEVFIHEEKTTQ